MEDVIEFRIDEPYASRLGDVRAKELKFENDPMRNVAPNLIGEATVGLALVAQKAWILGSALVHRSVHINR